MTLLTTAWVALQRIFFLVGPKDPKMSALVNFLGGSFSGRTWSHTTRLNSCVKKVKRFCKQWCFPVKAYCPSVFLNKHAVDMFNEFLFSLGDFGKICLPHPYTTASLIFLVHWQIFPNFAHRGRIRKSSNFDLIFGKTNRFRSSATHTYLSFITFAADYSWVGFIQKSYLNVTIFKPRQKFGRLLYLANLIFIINNSITSSRFPTCILFYFNNPYLLVLNS